MGFFDRFKKSHSGDESNISRVLRAVVASDNAQTREDLFDALRRQRLIIPVPRQPDNLSRAAGQLLQSARIEFLTFCDRQGTPIL